MTNPQDQQFSYSNLMNLLFDHIRKPNGRPYTMMEVAELSGVKYETIRAIKLGLSQNPSIGTLLPIAKFFGVSLAYFEAETEEAALDLIKQEIKIIPLANRYAFRIANLSENARHDIERILAWIEEAEAARSPLEKDKPNVRVTPPQKQ